MKALIFALLMLPAPCALGCIIGWVTTIDGEERSLTCGYMFDDAEVVLAFKDRMRLTYSRNPANRFGTTDAKEDEWKRTRVSSDVENPPVDVINGDTAPLAPLAPRLAVVDQLLDAGLIVEALEHLQTIKPARKQRAAYRALRVRAFELQGDFAAAQSELARLLRVDPACHSYSEQVHAFILAAKEKLRAGTLDLARDSVLPATGYAPMVKAVTLPSAEWRPLRRLSGGRDLFDAILTQIHLQENFFGGDRRIIADLYYELGHIAAVTYWLERAVDYYELALAYGSPKTEVIEQILAHYRDVIAHRPHTQEEAHRGMFRAAVEQEGSAESTWVADLPLIVEPSAAQPAGEGASPTTP
jgi:tetratricopeptide (TPR) repeat protein